MMSYAAPGPPLRAASALCSTSRATEQCFVRASGRSGALWRVGESRRCSRLRPRSLRLCAAAASGGALKSWPPKEVWSAFLGSQEGRWESTSAVFAADGALQPLPARFVPPAYTEWGQTVHEWQGLVTSASEQGRLRNTLQRYWPTVGCEYGKNDVAETHSQLLFDVAGVCKGLVAEGGYSDSPETLPLSGGTLRCEQCLYDSSPGESDAETRIRLVYSLQGALPATPGPCVWRLSEVEMFHERRLDVAGRNSSPATDTRTDGFALTDRTPPAALTSGYWEASSGATLSLFPGPPPTVVPVPWWGLEPKPQWATAPRCSALPAGTATLLHLPLGVWAYVEQARSDMLIVESGQVLPSGQRRVVACSYSHGALDSFVIGTDEEISLANARAKGYITGEDAAEQAYYNDLLETLDMDSDEVRGGLTKDATPFE